MMPTSSTTRSNTKNMRHPEGDCAAVASRDRFSARQTPPNSNQAAATRQDLVDSAHGLAAIGPTYWPVDTASTLHDASACRQS